MKESEGSQPFEAKRFGVPSRICIQCRPTNRAPDGWDSARFQPVFSVSAKFRFRAFSTVRPHPDNVDGYFFQQPVILYDAYSLLLAFRPAWRMCHFFAV